MVRTPCGNSDLLGCAAARRPEVGTESGSRIQDRTFPNADAVVAGNGRQRRSRLVDGYAGRTLTTRSVRNGNGVSAWRIYGCRLSGA